MARMTQDDGDFSPAVAGTWRRGVIYAAAWIDRLPNKFLATGTGAGVWLDNGEAFHSNIGDKAVRYSGRLVLENE